ncbi:MAG: hypothetical protein RL318_1452 [Fibrobacterota bacterium]|jgi:hypothetical protein
MKERTERTVRLNPRWSEAQTIDLLEQEAARMHDQGWGYLGSHVDELFETVVLFFERDLDLPSP